MHRRDFLKSITVLGATPLLFPLRTWSQTVLPKVLIIGDSISIGYTPTTISLLTGKADVSRISGNGQDTNYALVNIDTWLGQTNWDLIHFNWGLWDLCYRNPASTNQGNRDKINGTLTTTLANYDANLRLLVARLKQTGAKLVWANTTPVPEGELGRFVGDDLRYNAVAEPIMRDNGIVINDLNSYIRPRFDEFQIAYGDVHYTIAGYNFLAQEVARVIEATLRNPVSISPRISKRGQSLNPKNDEWVNVKGQKLGLGRSIDYPLK